MSRTRTRRQPTPIQRDARRLIRYLIEGSGPNTDPIITSPKKGAESWYRDRLAQALNGKKEVRTPQGRIDVLTATELIEVKRMSGWKEAIGQVIAYGRAYPHHRLRIHLFGDASRAKLQQIEKVCQSQNILVTWE